MKCTASTFKKLIPYLLIAGGALLAYGLSLYNDFTFDDHYSILENPSLKNPVLLKYLFTPRYFEISHEASYRPLITLLNFIEFSIFEQNPIGYHVINLILHILCSIMTMALTAKLASRHIALFTGLLHAVHPALSETVVSVSFAEDMLCCFFLLGTLISILKVLSSSDTLQNLGWNGLACIMFLCALLSKETALFLPLFILPILFFTPIRPKTSVLYCIAVELIVLTLIFTLIRFTVLANLSASDLNKFNSFSQWFGLFTYFPDYIKTYFLPVYLSIIHPLKETFPHSFSALLFCIVISISLCMLCLYTMRKKYIYSLGLGWFMLGLLPVSGIIPLKFPFAERYIYIPSLGLSFICAGYFAYVFCIYRNVPEKTHRIPRIGCLALFSLLIVLSIDRTADWKTDFSLWKATYKTTPNSPVVLYSLGKIFQDTNRLNKAEKAYRRAIALNEAYLAPYMNLAVIYIDEKRFGNALSVNAEILKRDPYCAIAHFNNAIIYKELNKKEMELSSYTKAIESDPHFTPAYSALASYYMKQNDSAKALETLSSGINKNHSWIEGYKQFYSYAVKSGNRSAFEAVIKQGIQSNPSSKELRLLYLKFNAEN